MASTWKVYRSEVRDDGMLVSTLFCEAHSIEAAGEIVNILEKYSKKPNGKNYSYHVEKIYHSGTPNDLGCGA